ncbi:uncharacterized protein LOC116263556 [Nymphaea colorata]|nr:uncharacterized protein LOC116263556 [Nymphaea colorata]
MSGGLTSPNIRKLGISQGTIDQFITSSMPEPNALKKEEMKQVYSAIGQFFFANDLSFNLCNNPYFERMIEAMGNYGRGLKPPTYNDMQASILKEEVDKVQIKLEDNKKTWLKTSCTIMADGWIGGKSGNLINFLIVKEVGEKNVVQVVTNNAANYKAASMKLKEIDGFNHIFWTPCAADCLDLILEDIAKIHLHKEVIEKAKVSIRINKIALKNMFLSPEFQGSDYYTKNPKGKEVLRVVDSDEKPVMGFLYNHMRRTKEEITYNVDNNQKSPHFHYDDDVLKDRRIKDELIECLDIMVPTGEERCDILVQLDSYENEVADWKNTFGDNTKELKNFAMRTLNLTCSASGYDSWLHSLFEIEDINILPFEDISRSMKKRKSASSSQKKSIGKGKTIIEAFEHESFDDKATEEEDEPIQYTDNSNDDELSFIKEDNNDENTIDLLPTKII